MSFQDMNLVGDVYVYGDETNYCAGCNGNFRLTFDNTSLTFNGGVFGVAVDIVLGADLLEQHRQGGRLFLSIMSKHWTSGLG